MSVKGYRKAKYNTEIKTELNINFLLQAVLFGINISGGIDAC